MAYPDLYRGGGLVVSRKQEKALARQMGATASELMALDHVQLVERAKVRVVGAVAADAVDEIVHIADEVVVAAQRNPLAGELAARLAFDAERALSRRIERANDRLG